MAKLKTFEQYVAEMDRSEEIEDTVVKTGEPEEKDIEEVEDEAEEVQANEATVTEDEHATEEEAEEEAEEEVIPVSEMLENCYAHVKEEAAVWESDAHDEHTVETYMVENAALVATLAASSLKEMKNESSNEAYEATLNQMVEAYTKKCNEMKESSSQPGAELED